MENDNGKSWYVVHTYSGHENKVKENIQKMIKSSKIDDHFGQIIVPTEEVAEMKKGKKTISTRKFFPSYILIEMHMTDESRHLVGDMLTINDPTSGSPYPFSGDGGTVYDNEIEVTIDATGMDDMTVLQITECVADIMLVK